MKPILISTSTFGEYSQEPLNALKENGYRPILNPFGRTLTSEEIIAQAAGCTGIVAGTEKYTREILSRCPNLRVISRCGSGTDAIDMAAARERGITVENTPFGPTQAVVELTLGMILNLIRHVQSANAQLKRGEWGKQMGYLAHELVFGIMGLGRIGRRLAVQLRTLDATVMGCDIAPDPVWAAKAGVSIRDRADLIRESDVLCLHLPLEKGLKHLIGAEEFAAMKPGSFIVNTSRGGLIDEKALYNALKSGHLAGAALDVFENEPYNGPLRELDSVLLTPHVGSYARAGRVKMEIDAVQNLITALNTVPVEVAREEI